MVKDLIFSKNVIMETRLLWVWYRFGDIVIFTLLSIPISKDKSRRGDPSFNTQCLPEFGRVENAVIRHYPDIYKAMINVKPIKMVLTFRCPD